MHIERPAMGTAIENPPLLHLFGLTGAGKSHLARLLASNLGYFVYEADSDFTPRMRAATARGETFTDDMRDEFYEKAAKKLKALSSVHPLVVMPQAAYRNRHRQYLMSQLPSLRQVWVRSSQALMEKRIVERGGEVTLDYSRRVKSFFEPPPEGTPEIVNNGGSAELFEQFLALLSFRRVL